jgi:hypothetical protein
MRENVRKQKGAPDPAAPPRAKAEPLTDDERADLEELLVHAIVRAGMILAGELLRPDAPAEAAPASPSAVEAPPPPPAPPEPQHAPAAEKPPVAARPPEPAAPPPEPERFATVQRRPDGYLTMDEIVAVGIEISLTSVSNWVKQGRLPAVYVAGLARGGREKMVVHEETLRRLAEGAKAHRDRIMRRGVEAGADE